MTPEAAVSPNKPNRSPAYWEQQLLPLLNSKDKIPETLLQQLVQEPLCVPAFFQAIANLMYQAELAKDQDAINSLLKRQDQVEEYMNKFAWQTLVKRSLNTEETVLFLENIARYGQKPTKKIDKQHRIYHQLLRGYLNERFLTEEQGKTSWREALHTLERLFQGAMDSNSDLSHLNAWLDLLIGTYPQINAQSTAGDKYEPPLWKSTELGLHSVVPEDEDLMRLGADIYACAAKIARTLNRKTDYSRYISQISRRGFLNGSLLYTLAKKRGNTPSIKSAHTWDNASKDVQELAQRIASDYSGPTRNALLDKALLQGQRTFDSETSLVALLPIKARGQKLDWPESVIYTFGPLSRQLERFREDSTMYLVETAKRLSERESMTSVEFNIGGMKGFIVSKENLSALTANKRTERIIQLFQEYDITTKWKMALQQTLDQLDSPTVVVAIPNHDNPEFFVVFSKTIVHLGPTEANLDYSVPEDLRLNAIVLARENMLDRRAIPELVRRIPTRAGDWYDLSKEATLPNVISSARVYRQPPNGLGIALNLVPNEVTNDPADLLIEASVQFKNGFMHVLFDKIDADFAPDLSWILERVVISLVRESCCTTLAENDAEEASADVAERGNVPPHNRAGHIQRVGGRRLDGDRKQFTDWAAANLAAAHEDLGDPMSLPSLEGINAAFQEEERVKGNPDPYFLTYHRAVDVDNDTPVERTLRSPLLPGQVPTTPATMPPAHAYD